MANRIEGDVTITGRLTAQYFTPPNSSVTNSHVQSSADIEASKLEHYHQLTYAQPNTAAADETRVIHVCRADGEVLAFSAGSIAIAVGGATCTFDLKKNGTTILTGVITLDSGNTNRVAEAGSITGGTFVSGDVLEVVIDGTVGGGTLPTGVFCNAKIREKAA